MHGDTVLVAPGVYSGPGNRDIKFNGKRILVASEAGREQTIVDCQGSAAEPHRGFDFVSTGETNDSILRGFTIQGGHAVSGGALGGVGAGIRVSLTEPTIEQCVVRQCTGESAFYFESIGGVARSCQILENATLGVDLRRAGYMTNCAISQNTGGGATLDYGCLIEYSTVSGNQAWGVLLLHTFGTSLRGCLISGNVGSPIYGAGVYMATTFQGIIEDCTIAGNRAQADGAGVVLRYDAEQTTFSRCVIRDNCPSDLLVTTGCDLTLECSALDPLEVTGSGSVFYSGPQVIVDPMFCGTEACDLAPTTAGNYTLQAGSPCLPENSPCGELIGALGEGCSPASIPEAGIARPTLLVAAIPNPSRESVVLRLALPEASQGRDLAASAAVFDVSGREVSRVARVLAPGQDEPRLNVDQLQPGTFFARVRVGDREGSTRFLVVR
ncbi:MAG: right-handed parallel beta-helix repeat-containing protein [Candidatus Eisenbacteria bacterium]